MKEVVRMEGKALKKKEGVQEPGGRESQGRVLMNGNEAIARSL